jgi:hypothetical protein
MRKIDILLSNPDDFITNCKEQLTEIFTDCVYSMLTEAAPKRIIRINSRGQRVRKKICQKGFKLVDGSRCVPMSGKEKRNKKLAMRKAVRTKKRNSSKMRQANRKRKMAMTKRRNLHIK